MDQTRNLQIFSMTLSQLSFPCKMVIHWSLPMAFMQMWLIFHFQVWIDRKYQA